MIDRTKLTIDAYLRQAGLKPPSTEPTRRFIPLPPMTETGFDRVLEGVDARADETAGGRTTGLTIADYLSRRTVSAHPALFNHSTRFRDGHGSRLASIDRRLQPTVAHGNAAAPTAAGSQTGQDDRIAGSIRAAAQKYHLPASLIENVIRAESNFRADAISPAGAQGLMQLMPATARELGVRDAFDVEQNIDGGARYLRQMLDRFDGDVKLALAAYNAGPGAVERHGHTIPPYEETQAYVRRILAALTPSENTVA